MMEHFNDLMGGKNMNIRLSAQLVGLAFWCERLRSSLSSLMMS